MRNKKETLNVETTRSKRVVKSDSLKIGSHGLNSFSNIEKLDSHSLVFRVSSVDEITGQVHSVLDRERKTTVTTKLKPTTSFSFLVSPGNLYAVNSFYFDKSNFIHAIKYPWIERIMQCNSGVFFEISDLLRGTCQIHSVFKCADNTFGVLICPEVSMCLEKNTVFGNLIFSESLD